MVRMFIPPERIIIITSNSGKKGRNVEVLSLIKEICNNNIFNKELIFHHGNDDVVADNNSEIWNDNSWHCQLQVLKTLALTSSALVHDLGFCGKDVLLCFLTP